MKKKSWRYYHFTNVYHKWQSYDAWFLSYGLQQTEVFVILDHFLPFYPTNNPKNKSFEKMEKTPGDIIILHKCTKNDDHVLHCSWDMTHDGCKFYFSFRIIFCPFAQKIKILQKWKKTLEISSLYTCAPKIMITWCMVPEIWCTTDGQTDKRTYGRMDRKSDM